MRFLACFMLCAALGCTSSSSGSGSGAGLGPTCGAFGGSDLVDGSTSCSLHYAECSDGLTYSVTCPGPPAPCTCDVDGGAAGEFDGGICGLSPTSPSLLASVNQGCGWDIR
jgi:hypothetical protein